MRLVRMEVAGFRGLPQPVVFDLDADAVILVGVNGSGKTSFFDAILWALSGRVDRLDKGAEPLVSKYSPTGEARVELVLRTEGGAESRVVRRFDGFMHLSVYQDAREPMTGPAAESALLDLLWPDASSATDPITALSRSLTRATYLQQDAVREFVSADDEQQRFQVVGELVGIGRVSDLQRQLESGRNAWTRATTALEKELEPFLLQRLTVSQRLSRLPDSGSSDVLAEAEAWKRESAELLMSPNVSTGDGSGSEPRGSVDLLVAALTRAEQTLLRRIRSLDQLAALLRDRPEPGPELAPIELAVRAAEGVRDQAAAALASAEADASEHRRLEAELRDTQDSLRALAKLAQRHLGDRCPVCGQEYDEESTRSRLQALADSTSPIEGESRTVPSETVSHAARILEQAENSLTAQRERARSAKAASKAYAEWKQEASTLQSALGLSSEVVSAEVEAEKQVTTSSLLRTREMRSRGERLALESARVAEQSQRSALTQQLQQLEESIAVRQAAIRLRNETSDEVSAVIAALRNANETLVTEQLNRIEPLLQRVFASVDPHPTFRAVNFLTRTERGRGRLWTTLGDVSGGVTGVNPAMVLSSSQLNVLAVSVFLAFNLAIPTLPLQMVALDDPLQSLDNVNLLGLTDLLRRVTDTRQVVVSTHDHRLAGLLERKLRPVGEGSRAVRIDLRGWSSAGPVVQITDVEADSGSLKLVASA